MKTLIKNNYLFGLDFFILPDHPGKSFTFARFLVRPVL
jgi:hypothetical protein